MIEAPDPQQPGLDQAVVFSGALSPSAEALFSHHVVGGTIILPGVGYVEMAFAASSGRALAAVAFLRPCVLPEPGRGEKCVLRCTRRARALAIASARGNGSSSFATCFAGTLVNIGGSHAETVSGRRFIKTPSLRRNPMAPQATSGPRPRLLQLSPRIGGTVRTFSAQKSLQSTLLMRSRVTGHSRNGKSTQPSIANIQEIPLGTIEPAKLPSAGSIKRRSARGRQQPAAAKRTHSRDALLKELTGIASEVIGTTLSPDAPLMDAGLDSIGATEL